jgi:purine-binding chemotaxis protein CheW
VRLAEQTLGLLVDGVKEIITMDEAHIAPAPSGVSGIATSYMAGIGMVDERMIYLLDLDKIFHTEEKEALLALTEE